MLRCSFAMNLNFLMLLFLLFLSMICHYSNQIIVIFCKISTSKFNKNDTFVFKMVIFVSNLILAMLTKKINDSIHASWLLNNLTETWDAVLHGIEPLPGEIFFTMVSRCAHNWICKTCSNVQNAQAHKCTNEQICEWKLNWCGTSANNKT